MPSRVLAALLTGLFLAGTACAEQAPIPMPADNKLVVFSYDPNDSYTILTIPGTATDIELAPNEEIGALAVGDSVQWKVEKAKNHVFVRPARSGIFTSATLVTSQRTYQLTLRSSPAGGKWFQRVSFSYPDILIAREEARVAATAVAAAEEARRVAPIVSGPKAASAVVVDNLNFSYAVKGDAKFKPETIYDDGTFTYIRLPASVRQMPAVFVKSPSGKYELINFTVNDNTLKVQSVFDVAVLKLSEEEIEITNQKGAPPPKKSFFSGFNFFGN